MALRQAVQGVAGEELLRDLPLELDAMGSVSCHGFHPSKARRTRSTHSASTVRPEGPTPNPDQFWVEINSQRTQGRSAVLNADHGEALASLQSDLQQSFYRQKLRSFYVPVNGTWKAVACQRGFKGTFLYISWL